MAAKTASQNGHATTAPADDTSPAVAVAEIPRLSTETILVPVVGTAPLIMHRWSEKAKRQMLDAQQGRKTPKTVRDPQGDYEATIYRTAGGAGYGFPVLAFKAATISGARYFGKSITMTQLRQFLFFTGVVSDDGRDLLTPITGEPVMREDMVRVGQGTDLRYRAEFPVWSATLRVTYVTSSISRDSVLSLVDAGGLGVGVGEWRPEKRGQNGTYQIASDVDVEVLRG